MIYRSKDGDIDLSNLIRLYPAGIVRFEGETAEMSLEWCEMNEDKIKIDDFVLVFDFTPADAEVKQKRVLHFSSKDELIDVMSEVAQFFQK